LRLPASIAASRQSYAKCGPRMQQSERSRRRRYRPKIDRIGLQIGFIPTLGPFSASFLSDSLSMLAARCHVMNPAFIAPQPWLLRTLWPGEMGTD
jgi:hypothetical protein